MIDLPAGRAVYRQIADELRQKINSGSIAPGVLLPSSAQLEGTYGVSRETIRRTLAVLRAEGLVQTEPGVGTRVQFPEQQTKVAVPRGALIASRPATPDEQADHDVPPGGHVLIVTIGGRVRGVYPAHRTVLTAS
ncbi:GntR family transcriptional regulator [Micromonospora sp. NPDC004704]